MTEMIQILLKILPIILLLGLGAWMRKKEFISKEAVGGLKKFTLNIVIPALLFDSFLLADLKAEVLLLSAVIFAACLFGFMVGFIFKRIGKSANPFYPSLFTTYLTGPIGFPIFIAYFGAENFYHLAILDIGNSLFLFTVLTGFLSTVSCDMNSIPKLPFRNHLTAMVKSPLTLGMVFGAALSMAGVSPLIINDPLGTALLDAVAIAASAAVPLSLIIVGFELPLEFRRFKNILPAVLLRLTMMMILAYLINTLIIVRWLHLDELYSAALFTMFILPPPFIIPMSIIGECDHKQYVLDFISLHLVVSLVAFIGVIYLL